MRDDTLDNIYFDLENTELDLNKLYSVIKFGIKAYDDIECYDALDFYSLFLCLKDRLDTVSKDILAIKEKLEKTENKNTP